MKLVKDPAAEIIRLHLECLASATKSLDIAIKVGENLAKQKKDMDHGTFIPWIKETLPFSERTAQNYMKLFDNKKKLLEGNVENVTEAYMLIAPEKKKSVPGPIRERPLEDTIVKEIAHDVSESIIKKQKTYLNYWEDLGPLIDVMEKTFSRLHSLRDSTTPVSLGFMIGNIIDMVNVLKTWDPNELETCEACGGSGCEICVNGKLGMFQQSEF